MPYAFFGFPGQIELVIVLAIGVLLFGKQLPSLMRNLGKAIPSFKKGMQEVEDEVDKITQPLKETVEATQEATSDLKVHRRA